jgi:predicted small lipoprotein YifL
VRLQPRGALALLLAAGALVACGKKGPPLAPELRIPAAPADLHGAVDQQTIVVSWTATTRRMDNSRLRTVELYKLYRREEAPDAGPPKAAMLSSGRVVGYDEIATIQTDSPAPAQIQGSTITWVDRQRLSVGRRYVYVVTTEDNLGRSSSPSARLVVPLLPAPRPPGALRATPGNRQVSLTWEAPTELSDRSPVDGEVRYVVLRASGEGGSLAAITPQPIKETSFTDSGLENDHDYRYAVRSVRVDAAVNTTGEASAAVTVAPVNVTPPSAPTGLVAIPTGGAVRLAWNPSPEPDVALYAVYRASEEGGEFMRIATTPAITTVYADRDARAGASYRYAVTAIDSARRPNESARSNVVSVRAE